MWINIGYGNVVLSSQCAAIVDTNSQPVKKTIKSAMSHGKLLDGTRGKKARSLIMLLSGQYVLSAIDKDTLVSRSHNSHRRGMEERRAFIDEKELKIKPQKKTKKGNK